MMDVQGNAAMLFVCGELLFVWELDVGMDNGCLFVCVCANTHVCVGENTHVCV